MAKNNKKYEITIDGLTVDFRSVLSNTHEYNEHFCNSFSNLVYIVTLPHRESLADVQAQCEHEIYARAYNYMRRTRGYDARTGIAFGEALRDKIISYRRAV